MLRIMLKSKIHRATVTGTELDYEGSIAIDEDLLEKADLLPNEQVHVLNLSNSARMITYAIIAPRGSGTIMLNGAAARLVVAGDKVIILSYCEMDDKEAKTHQPIIIFVDKNNRLTTG
ncbi:MAG: aspartate 1-decarboxylase [bacterium]|nr:aspartate 1-decarboxylase [bacterium]